MCIEKAGYFRTTKSLKAWKVTIKRMDPHTRKVSTSTGPFYPIDMKMDCWMRCDEPFFGWHGWSVFPRESDAYTFLDYMWERDYTKYEITPCLVHGIIHVGWQGIGPEDGIPRVAWAAEWIRFPSPDKYDMPIKTMPISHEII